MTHGPSLTVLNVPKVCGEYALSKLDLNTKVISNQNSTRKPVGFMQSCYDITQKL